MDNKGFYSQDTPFMIRRQDTGACAVLLHSLDYPATNQATYQSLVSSIKDLFSLKKPNRSSAPEEKLINKLEARWLPRRGYDSEGYPHTLLLDETNAHAILKLILQRQGTDIIEVTVETDEEKENRLSRNRY